MQVVITNGFGEYVGEDTIHAPAHLAKLFDVGDASGINVPPGYRVQSTRPQSRPVAYIAGPISHGPLHANVNQGTLAAMHLTAAGYAPICPMWSVYSAFPAVPLIEGCLCAGTASGNVPYEDVLDVDMHLIRRCDLLLRLPGESPGADREVEKARAYGIPVHFGVEELIGPPRWVQSFDVPEKDTVVTHFARAYRKIDLIHAVRHAVVALGHTQPLAVGEPKCLV